MTLHSRTVNLLEHLITQKTIINCRKQIRQLFSSLNDHDFCTKQEERYPGEHDNLHNQLLQLTDKWEELDIFNSTRCWCPLQASQTCTRGLYYSLRFLNIKYIRDTTFTFANLSHITLRIQNTNFNDMTFNTANVNDMMILNDVNLFGMNDDAKNDNMNDNNITNHTSPKITTYTLHKRLRTSEILNEDDRNFIEKDERDTQHDDSLLKYPTINWTKTRQTFYNLTRKEMEMGTPELTRRRIEWKYAVIFECEKRWSAIIKLLNEEVDKQKVNIVNANLQRKWMREENELNRMEGELVEGCEEFARMACIFGTLLNLENYAKKTEEMMKNDLLVLNLGGYFRGDVVACVLGYVGWENVDLENITTCQFCASPYVGNLEKLTVVEVSNEHFASDEPKKKTRWITRCLT